MQILQDCILHFVNTLYLTDQSFRIADYLQCSVSTGLRVFERGDQGLVLGKVVGLVPQIFTQFGNSLPALVFNHYSVSGWPGIATRPAVGMGDQVMCRRLTGRMCKQTA